MAVLLSIPRVVLIPLVALSAVALAALEPLAKLGLSALPLAILLGMLLAQLESGVLEPRDERITRFCQQRLLRLGIVLFGFSLSWQQILAVGWQAVVLDALVVCTVFATGAWVGIRLLKLDRDVALLTSAGSAICGAAAVLATESVLKPQQRDVAVAVATVVLFGTLAMFSYPLLYPLTGMSEQAFGIYIGSTAHEVAQAVAAGEGIGEAALHHAVVVKLIRVMMLAPFILLLSSYLHRSERSPGLPARLMIPWFVLGFIAATGVNSMLSLSAPVLDLLSQASQVCLALAMAALGLQTRWQFIRSAGLRPLLLAAILFLLLMAGGLVLNRLLLTP